MWDFVLKFGRHLPGARSTFRPPRFPPGKPKRPPLPRRRVLPPRRPRFPTTGAGNSPDNLASTAWSVTATAPSYDSEAWWNQITKQNFAWAPAVALGIADVDGDVSKLPADFDPAAAPAPAGECGRESGSRAQQQADEGYVRKCSTKLYFL